MGRKVLIMCVGTNDPTSVNPRTKEICDGPVLSFMSYIADVPHLKALQPDRVYLLATAERPDAVTPTQQGGERTRDILLQRGYKEVYLRLLPLKDPTSYKELIPALRGEVERIVGENTDVDCEYFVNVSPGTGQMEATWLALVNSGVIKASLLQVKAPWVEPDPSKRVIRIEEAPLFENNRIEVASSLLSHYEFEGARDVLLDLGMRTTSPLRTETADLFSHICEGYFHYDSCAFDKAAGCLSRALSKSLFKDERFFELGQLLSLQRKILDKLASNSAFEGVADLYHRARRYSDNQRYSLAILFCWQACEKLLVEQAKDAVRSECKLPGNYDIPYHFGRFIEKYRETPEVKRISERFPFPRLRVFDIAYAIGILRRTRLPAAKVLETERANIEWLEEARNRIVHEPLSRASSKKHCDVALQLVSRLIRGCFGNDNELFDYPFSTQSFRKVRLWVSQLI